MGSCTSSAGRATSQPVAPHDLRNIAPGNTHSAPATNTTQICECKSGAACRVKAVRIVKSKIPQSLKGVNTRLVKGRTFGGEVRLGRVCKVYNECVVDIATRLYDQEPYAKYQIHLIGYIAPSSSSRNKEEQKLGAAAARLLQSVLQEGDYVFLRMQGQDEKGREKAEVYLAAPTKTHNMAVWGDAVAERMILAHLAKPYNGKGTAPRWNPVELQTMQLQQS